MNIQFSIKGERCSGTNYLRFLLLKNFSNAELVDVGWKHDFLDIRAPEIYGVRDNYIMFVMFRNPYDWIRSLHKNPHHLHPDFRDKVFSDFIRSEWVSIIEGFTEYERPNISHRAELLLERHPLTLERFKNAFQLRNAKNINFLGMKNIFNNIFFINIEDLQKDWARYITELNDIFFKNKGLVPQNVDLYKGEELFGQYIPAIYDKIGDDDFNFMVDQLDWSVERAIGYSLDQINRN